MSSLSLIATFERQRIISAMIQRAAIGYKLCNDMPQIAQAYREGASHAEIADMFGICELYHISQRAAKDAIGHALRGYNGKVHVQYHGQLSVNEVAELRTKNRKKRTRTYFETKTGLFSVDEEQRREMNSLIAASGGEAAYAKCKGIHALTREQRVANGRKGAQNSASKGGIAATLTKGDTPWYMPTTEETAMGVMKEIEFAHSIWNPQRNVIDNIVESLNEYYHNKQPIRDPESVSAALARYREKLGIQSNRIKQPTWFVPTTEQAAEGAIAEIVYAHEIWEKHNNSFAQIIDAINEKYHKGQQVRTWGSVSGALSRYRKSIESK